MHVTYSNIINMIIEYVARIEYVVTHELISNVVSGIVLRLTQS